MPAPLEPLQSAADEVITAWPEVQVKPVFGHRAYVRGSTMFAFLANQGLSFKTHDISEAVALYESGAAKPFVYNGGMEMRAWPVLPLATDEDLSAALEAAWTAYETLGSPVRHQTASR